MRFLKSIILASIAGLATGPAARADLIAYWNFNGLTASTNNGTTYAPTTGSGTLTLDVLNTTGTSGITSFGGSTINAISPDPAGQSLVVQGGKTGDSGATNNGSTLTLKFSMTGFENPIVTFAGQDTATGFQTLNVYYSTDGTNFTDTAAPITGISTLFSLQTVTLSSFDALDGATDAYVRFELLGATGQSGNIRFDNFQINASAAAAIPEPSSMLLVGAMATCGFGWVRRRKLAAQ